MLKEYKIKVTSVDYDVTYDDIDYNLLNAFFNAGDTVEEVEKQADEEIERIKSELPQELHLIITCEPEDLDDEIADAISEETGWLNNSFTYDIVSETEVDEDDYPAAIGSEGPCDFLENVVIEVSDNTVYLAHDGSSGSKYEFNNKDELKQIVADYVADIIDYYYED